MRDKISVVISAYNETKNIADCLRSVAWADEIILVDNSSSDDTAVIARKMGAKVYQQPNRLMLNTNKNYGFEKAKNKWILNLDADERVDKDLQQEILAVIKKKDNEINGYLIPRKNIIFGKWIKHSLWWPDYQLRLFKKGKGIFAEKHVHEKIKVNGKTSELISPIVHFNYQNISQFIYKMEHIYSKNEAQVLAGKKLAWEDFIYEPGNDFIKTFLSLRGYQDDAHGLILSILQSFYTFVSYAKAWEKQKYENLVGKVNLDQLNQVLKKLGRNYKYWYYQQKIEQAPNFLVRIYWKIVRKITVLVC